MFTKCPSLSSHCKVKAKSELRRSTELRETTFEEEGTPTDPGNIYNHLKGNSYGTEGDRSEDTCYDEKGNLVWISFQDKPIPPLLEGSNVSYT